MWPENWHVVRLFVKCETQWHVAANGRCVGFNYPGVEVVMRHNKKLVDDADLAFEQLQVMEVAACGVLNG